MFIGHSAIVLLVFEFSPYPPPPLRRFPCTKNPLSSWTAVDRRYQSVPDMLMGLPDPVFCTDSDPSIKEQKIIKNLDFCCLVTSLMTKRAGSGSVNKKYGSKDPEPNPYQTLAA